MLIFEVTYSPEASIELRLAIMRLHGLGTCKYRVPLGIFGTKREEVPGEMGAVKREASLTVGHI